MRKVKKKTKGKGLWNWMKRHKVISGILCLLILCFLVMAMSLGVLLWNLNKNNVGIVDPDDVDPNADKVQIAREDQKDKDVINVLLVGSDSRDPNAEMGRSDTMILASFNKAEGKATALSFLRDSLVEIDGHGQSKLGHTYAYGGVGLTINTLNKQFGLDIQNYVVINFENLVEIIDQLGGIQVVLTEEEAEYYRESDFQITYTDNAANVTAYTMSYAGDDDSGNMRWTKDEDSVSTIADANNPDKLHISVSGQTVSVTNFDFAENFVHMLHKDDGTDTPQGKKLVVEIDIAAADDSQGGIKLATNATNMTHTDNAGIYGSDSDRPVAEFPLPHVDLPTTVTIQKAVEGSTSTEDFSFEAAYVKAGDYENITAEESGGDNDSNYLHLKDGTNQTDTFTLKNGGTHKLENVEVGSSLTISETAKGWIPTVTTSAGTEALTPDADGKYTVTVTPGMVITFTNRPETIDISGSKTWDDADNQDGKRPDSITIRLYANGTELKDKALTVTAEDGWKWSFTDLPKYADGKEITYTISEDTVDGYTPTYTDFNITNTYTPEQTSVTVNKAWADNNDQDGIRPESVTVKLLANGEDTAKTLVLSDGNNWTGTFTGLDKYQNGKAIDYTVEETEVSGYDTVITGDAATGFVITNSHNPATTEVSGSKTWDDADNQDGKRPDSITIRLYADGAELGDKTLIVTAKDGWKWSFTDLPKYAEGKEIVYTISEDEVKNYTTTYDGYDVTNSYTPKKSSVSVALGASKILNGRALVDGEFSFELKDVNGNVLQTKQNDENGAINFDRITYDTAGRYTYTISEVVGDDATITYDDTVYNVIVTVTDSEEGDLTAEVTDENGDVLNAAFTNTYTQPADDIPAQGNSTDNSTGGASGVKTGDNADLLPILIVMAAAIIVIIAMSVILIRRRRR